MRCRMRTSTFAAHYSIGSVPHRFTMTGREEDEGEWIFGFGSLIHNPGFEHDERMVCYIRGFRYL